MMTIGEFQKWTAAHDERTGWDALSPLQVLAHLTEEVGEVAQAVNRLYEYDGEDAEAQRLKLGAEVADVLWFLTKIANRFDVDMEAQAGSLMERMNAATPGQYRSQLERGIRHLTSDALRAGARLPGVRTDPPVPGTTG